MPDRVVLGDPLRRWRTASALLGVAGLCISGYLSLVHLASAGVPLVCSTTDLVNCEQVTTSPQSLVGPIPVAYLGFGWFLVVLGLILGARGGPSGLVTRLQLIWSGLGVAFVLYLVYAELYVIGAICLWCTAVHGLVLALFLLAVSATEMHEQGAAAFDENSPSRH